MPNYYTQSFQNNNDAKHPVVWYYGAYTKHDHDKSNQFSVNAMDDLIAHHNWKREDIYTGHFASGQSKPPATGTELKWKQQQVLDKTGKPQTAAGKIVTKGVWKR